MPASPMPPTKRTVCLSRVCLPMSFSATQAPAPLFPCQSPLQEHHSRPPAWIALITRTPLTGCLTQSTNPTRTLNPLRLRPHSHLHRPTDQRLFQLSRP